MQFNVYKNTKTQLVLGFMSLIVLSSCGSFQYATPNSDGIYETDEKPVYPGSEQTIRVTDNNSNYYEDVFKEEANIYDLDSEDVIFTDIDSYHSDYVESDLGVENDYKGYAGWGQSNDQVVINIHSNNFGYNNYWWNSPYHGFGWNRPWGWNYGFGFGYGYYNSFWCPPSYYYGYAGHNRYYPNYYGGRYRNNGYRNGVYGRRGTVAYNNNRYSGVNSRATRSLSRRSNGQTVVNRRSGTTAATTSRRLNRNANRSVNTNPRVFRRGEATRSRTITSRSGVNRRGRIESNRQVRSSSRKSTSTRANTPRRSPQVQQRRAKTQTRTKTQSRTPRANTSRSRTYSKSSRTYSRSSSPSRSSRVSRSSGRSSGTISRRRR